MGRQGKATLARGALTRPPSTGLQYVWHGVCDDTRQSSSSGLWQDVALLECICL